MPIRRSLSHGPAGEKGEKGEKGDSGDLSFLDDAKAQTYFGTNDDGDLGFYDISSALAQTTIRENTKLSIVDGRYIPVNGEIPPSISHPFTHFSSTSITRTGICESISFTNDGLTILPSSGHDVYVKIDDVGEHQNFYTSVDVFISPRRRSWYSM